MLAKTKMLESLIDYLTGFFDGEWAPNELQAIAPVFFMLLTTLVLRGLYHPYKRPQNDPYKDTQFSENGAVKKR